MDYDPTIIEAFFGSAGEISEVGPTKHRILVIDYSAATLKYEIWLHLDNHAVGVSGDIAHPFGADSMYEICVPCSAIVAGPDGYHPGQTCLSFLYGGTDINIHRRMTIMKTPTGELKVWPAYPFPLGHAYSSVTKTEV